MLTVPTSIGWPRSWASAMLATIALFFSVAVR